MFSIGVPKNKEEWNEAAVSLGALFTQSFEYGGSQKRIGRKVLRYLIRQDGTVIGVMSLIAFPLPFSRSYLYSPFGPVLQFETEELFVFLREKIKEIMKEEKVVFTRIELPEGTLGKKFFWKPVGRAKEGSYFQPRTDWQISLEISNEEIIANMNQSARRSLRRTESTEVSSEVFSVTDSEVVSEFLALMKETAKRNGFRLHPEEYYKALLAELKESNAFFVRTKVADETVGIVLLFVFGKEAMYLLGASADDKKESGATLYCQLAAMEEARNRGALVYNFGAVSAGKRGSKFDGITTFKKKFGGYEKKHGDFYDIVGEPLFYFAYIIRKLLRL